MEYPGHLPTLPHQIFIRFPVKKWVPSDGRDVCWEDELTLQEGDLNILAINGHSSSVLQLHKAAAQGRQPHAD